MARKTSTRNARTAPAPVIAGPAATRHADGRVMALRPGRYPEVEGDVDLYCAACHTLHPAQAFAFTTKKGAGEGRLVECRARFEKRLAENKERRAAGEATIPAPHIDDEHVVPKPATGAAAKAAQAAPAPAPAKAASTRRTRKAAPAKGAATA